MNRMALIIVLALGMVGCEKNSNPVSANSDIDARLVGEWLIKDSLSIGYPAPQHAFHGLQITQDKTISELGIEIRSGKVAAFNTAKFRSLIKANDGMLVVEVFAPPDLAIDTMYYDIQGEELLISDGYREKIYKRTKSGSQVTDPVSFDFSVLIDSVYFRSVEVYPYPASFASRISSADLFITALIPRAHLTIEINDFNGIGNYEIPFGKGRLIIDGGDYIVDFISDSISTGTIAIDHYDEIENTCSGSFSFDVILNPSFHGGSEHKKLEGGNFSLPVYK